MKIIHIIQTHSFVDLITNSSTELFVCQWDKTIDMVKELIQTYCPMLSTDTYTVRWINEREKFIIKYKNYIEKIEYYDIIKKDNIKEEDINLFNKLSYNWEYLSISYWYQKFLDENSIIVEWESDNSIPYEYFDLLESVLNANSFHLW